MTTETTIAPCPTGCAHNGCHGICTTHGEPTRHYEGRSCDCPPEVPARTLPSYVYVASSWRNTVQPALIQVMRAAGIACYDFRNPEGGTGFAWREVKHRVCERSHPDEVDGQLVTCRYCRDGSPSIPAGEVKAKGSDWEQADEYLRMIEHPRAIEGFNADFDAMKRADTFVLVLPCGKSAHLELGWAVGAGKRTAILLEDPVEPELMYKMVDHIAPTVGSLLGWLGVGSDLA